ncbi:phosphoesterase PA-phosphatase [Cyanosarcina cf. burmensis CCALA 770]|jgi:membrane-associated phospholipid phosphatase|nr:phosphoesterase PA-phosphatase [Cyanosarcina cf. burmensis CCALA 770]
MEILWSVEPIIFVQRWFGESWSWFFETMTQLGSGGGIAIAFALAFWLKGRKLAWSLASAVIFVTAINAAIWSLFYVPRPQHPQISVYKQLDVSSFPSGHTGTATMLWGSLTVLSYLPAVITVCIVALVMLSRIYLGVHYLMDLLGGLAVGLISLFIYQRLLPVLVRWFSGRTFHFFLVLSFALPIVAFPAADAFPDGWEVFGAAVGVAIGMPLEYWYVRYHPAQVSLQKQVVKVAIGLGVLAGIVFVARLISSNELPRDPIAYGLAVFWIVFPAPALFARMGLSRTVEQRLR